MNFVDVQKFVDNFQGNKSVGQGASEDVIRSAETRLGVKITGSYRQFLAQYGWADIGYNEIFGLGDDTPDGLQLVPNTVWEQNEAYHRLPVNLIPIYNDGFGNLYAIDTDQIVNDENPIYFWYHEKLPGQPAEYISASFAAWFCNELMAEGD